MSFELHLMAPRLWHEKWSEDQTMLIRCCACRRPATRWQQRRWALRAREWQNVNAQLRGARSIGQEMEPRFGGFGFMTPDENNQRAIKKEEAWKDTERNQDAQKLTYLPSERKGRHNCLVTQQITVISGWKDTGSGCVESNRLIYLLTSTRWYLSWGFAFPNAVREEHLKTKHFHYFVFKTSKFIDSVKLID